MPTGKGEITLSQLLNRVAVLLLVVFIGFQMFSRVQNDAKDRLMRQAVRNFSNEANLYLEKNDNYSPETWQFNKSNFQTIYTCDFATQEAGDNLFSDPKIKPVIAAFVSNGELEISNINDMMCYLDSRYEDSYVLAIRNSKIDDEGSIEWKCISRGSVIDIVATPQELVGLVAANNLSCGS